MTQQTMEQQIAEMQAQISFLMGNREKTTVKRLEEIRSICRSKYFGTWDEVRDGVADYGPEKKGRSDYRAVMEIVRQTTDLLYRYAIGRNNSGSAVSALVKSEQEVKTYEQICESVCRELRTQIDRHTMKS